MLLRLFRTVPQGNALPGTLYIDAEPFCSTLENNTHCIASGFYRVRLTYSPRFDQVLPILDNVIGRSGIRIHAGNTATDSAGCILLGEASTLPDGTPRLLSSRRTLTTLIDLIRHALSEREAVCISITDADTALLYDTPCPPEQQQHFLDFGR